MDQWFDYVYLRDNPKGRFQEYWHHGGGCRSWLVVDRDTQTHEIFAVDDGSRLCASAEQEGQTLMAGFRLAKGGLIDRSATLNFTFDGKTFTGHPGDTLASALIANGVHLMGRSFKYHRPRGVISAGAAEPNALVELREGGRKEANTRATMIELYDGLLAEEPEPLAVARISISVRSTRSRPPSSSPASTTRPSCGRRASGRRSMSP